MSGNGLEIQVNVQAIKINHLINEGLLRLKTFQLKQPTFEVFLFLKQNKERTVS